MTTLLWIVGGIVGTVVVGLAVWAIALILATNNYRDDD